TDTPGGAALAGMFAALCGLSFALLESRWLRWLGLATAGIGLFCPFPCPGRSSPGRPAVARTAPAAAPLRPGDLPQSLGALLAIPAVALAGFLWASTIAEDAVVGRYSTLFAERPGQVYYSNRGIFLEHTIQVLLPEYPLGAGLARWGMMNYYFGDREF